MRARIAIAAGASLAAVAAIAASGAMLPMRPALVPDAPRERAVRVRRIRKCKKGKAPNSSSYRTLRARAHITAMRDRERAIGVHPKYRSRWRTRYSADDIKTWEATAAAYDRAHNLRR